jgi:hypothetical protein
LQIKAFYSTLETHFQMQQWTGKVNDCQIFSEQILVVYPREALACWLARSLYLFHLLSLHLSACRAGELRPIWYLSHGDYLGHFMSDQRMTSTMLSPIFMICIFQVDIHDLKVFPKIEVFIVTKSLNIN